MSSISQLKEAVRKANAECERVRAAPNNHPDVIAARKELEFALGKARLLNRSRLRRAERALSRAEEELHSAEQITLAPEIEELFRGFSSGVDYGSHWSRWRVRWTSDDKRFFIFTIPSSTAWSGIGCPRSYVPAANYLIDVRGEAPKGFSGLSFFNHKCVVKREGRLTKAVLDELVAIAGEEQ